MTAIYQTERLFLKLLNKNDASMVLSFYEENKSQFEPWEPKRDNHFYTLAYQKASLTAESNLMSEGKLLRYWVFTKDSPNTLIGSICFQNILREPYRSCSLGYKFSYKYLHQGYASESLKKCIEIVFEEYPIHRIEAYIMENNEPSLRLIERLSFRQEGLSCSYARIGGNWTDHLRYSLINPKDR
ncbi:MAG: GNAT family N-acetyltransferase [Herbinix sp.]|nr:GNAT family N-acetyltransferase [Herbinix sp.]